VTGRAGDGFSTLRPARQDHRLDVLLGTPLHRHLGMRPVADDDPTAGLTFTVTDALINNSQMLHGGLVATSLDVAAAYAIFPVLAGHEVVLTNSLSISYLRPAPLGSVVVARAEVLRRGRATAFLRSELVVERRTVATAQLVKAIVALEEE
jgi:uncharacterized protein (TIGR00369 family)